MARIAYPDPSTLAPDVRARFDAGDVREHMSLRRMMRHVPATQQQIEEIGLHFLRPDAPFSADEREVVVLTCGRLCRSPYEIFHHVEICRALGFPEEKINDLLAGEKARLSDRERLLVDFSEEIQRDGKVSDATFEIAREQFTTEQLVELPLVVGFYIMLAGFLNTLEIDVDERPGGTATLALIEANRR